MNLKNHHRKMILLSLLLGMSCSQLSFADHVPIKNVEKPIEKITDKSAEKTTDKIRLKDLNFKTVMMALHQKDLKYINIPVLEQQQLQYVGIQHIENAQGEDTSGVLIFSPVKSYRNAQNELRYLFTITQRAISPYNSQELEFCGNCTSLTTVYIFKKNAEQHYQLLSQSQDENGWLNLDYNYVPYPSEEIIKNIKKIGPKIKGYVEEQEFSRQGYSFTKLYIVPFDENQTLRKLEVAEISNDNEVTGDERTYNTQGDYHFLDTEHGGLYDIEIQYSGTKRQYTATSYDIVPVNETHVYQYNEKQQKYIRVK